jgi:hypothetical protein
LNVVRDWFVDATAGNGKAVGALVDVDLGVYGGGMHTVQVRAPFRVTR